MATPISPPATAPATTQSAANPATLTPFIRAQQRDCHEDIPACLAILMSKSIDEVFKAMESSGLPKTGPYHGYITETIISGVLIKSNLVATVWKESASWLDIPDVAIVMVDYNFEYETGRCLVCYRVKDMELTPFHGHLNLMNQGVCNAKTNNPQTALSTGVSPAHDRAGARGAQAQRIS